MIESFKIETESLRSQLNQKSELINNYELYFNILRSYIEKWLKTLNFSSSESSAVKNGERNLEEIMMKISADIAVLLGEKKSLESCLKEETETRKKLSQINAVYKSNQQAVIHMIIFALEILIQHQVKNAGMRKKLKGLFFKDSDKDIDRKKLLLFVLMIISKFQKTIIKAF